MHRFKAAVVTCCVGILLAPALAGDIAKEQAGAKATASTVVGEVVDAACYMIHPDSATGPGHKDCAKACADRGVPLAIISASDGKLYFPAGGNKELYDHIGQRVSATGTIVDKTDPMKLSMPVGDTNTLSVQVDGGYRVIAIQALSKVPAGK